MFVISFKRALGGILLAGAILFRLACAEDAVPPPAKLDSKDVLAYVVVQNVKGAIDTIEGFAKQVLPPNEFQAGMIAKKIGKDLGDPTLAHLGKKPIMLVVFKLPEGVEPGNGPPPLALFFPVDAAAPIEDTFKKDGAKTAFEDGVLMVAQSDDYLAKAKTFKAQYEKIAANPLACDARLGIDLAAVWQSLGPVIQSSLVQLREVAHAGIDKEKDSPQLAKIGIKAETLIQLSELGIKALEGLLTQADAVQLDLTLTPDSLSIEKTFAAKNGTLLADIFSGTPPPADPNLQSFLVKGFQMMYMRMDMKTMSANVKKIRDAIAADPATAGLANNEYFAMFSEPLDAIGGETVYSIGQGETGPVVRSASTINDGPKYLALQKKAIGMFGKDSFFSNLYKTLNMTFEMNFESAERQHAGVDISRMSVNIEMPKAPKEMAENMKKFTPNPEIATVKNYALISSNPAELDAMIDKTLKGDFSPSGVTLKSMDLYGKGKNLYMDYDFIGYMKYVMTKMNPGGMGADMFKQMKGGDPIVAAYSQGGGRSKFQMQIPVAPFLDFAKTIRAMGEGMVPKQPEKDDGKF